MGRSVSYPSGTALLAFDHIEIDNDDDGYWSYTDFIIDVCATASDLWPSMEESPGWAGREDRILLRNSLAEFGISEYCGLVAIWMRPRDDADENLALGWLNRIAPTFDKNFGSLELIGRASNGEAFFKKKEA